MVTSTNIRTTVDPPEALLLATPLGKWVYEAHAGVEEIVVQSEQTKHQTAWQVLCFLADLNKFFLQDAAAMWVQSEGRRHHPIYSELAVFQMDEWSAYCETMKDRISNDDSPLDAKLESVIPGLSRWQKVHDESLKRLHEAVSSVKTDVGGLEGSLDVLRGQQTDGFVGLKEDLAKSFAHAAIAMSPSQLQKTPPSSPPKQFADPLDEAVHHFTAGTNDPPLLGQAPILGDTSQVSIEEASMFTMRPRHKTLESLYCEFHGYSSAYGHPGDALGGIYGRDRRFGPKWRKHFNRQAFSRANRIVTFLDRWKDGRQISAIEAVAQFEPMWQDCKCSTATMVKLLQKKELLGVGKARGTKRKERDSD